MYGSEDFSNLDDYESLLFYINVDDNHWALIFIDRTSKAFYYIDSKESKQTEIRKGKEMIPKFKTFINNRNRNDGHKIKSQKWVNTSFQAKAITHSIQKDNDNCGVFAMKFGEEIILKYPEVPSRLSFNPNQDDLTYYQPNNVRFEIAKKINNCADLKTEYCSLCDKKFQVGELGEKEDVSVSCTFCGRCFHVINNRLCISQQPIPRKGFLCELCTLKQEKYPEVLEKIIDRCKNHPTIFKYHTSKLTNY